MVKQSNQSPEGSAGKEDVANRISSCLSVMAQSENDTSDITPPFRYRMTALLDKELLKLLRHFLSRIRIFLPTYNSLTRGYFSFSIVKP
ncbi:hypothetical protein [Francisella persica]|uniref:hypothetical protein n=1 Tax=Francisella persica TaxID=954 RepID=UPI000AE5168C|nr:hypothetical protein [Francisella persica]